MFVRNSKVSNIATNLKEYRTSHGYKQTEMADLLKMNYQNYSKMERGVYQPSLEKLLEICSILQMTPNDLLLEGRSFDDSKQDSIEKLDHNLINTLNIMHVIEEQRAKASFAHICGNYKEERFHLNLIYDILVKDDEKNNGYRKMLDILYYDYITSYIHDYSDKTHKELQQKLLEEN